MLWTLRNDEEIMPRKRLKLKYRRGDGIIQTFCTIVSPKKLDPLLLNSQKFDDSQKINPKPCRLHWNLRNDKEFGSRKLFKLKCKMVDQIIQTFCKISSPQKWDPSSLICRNLTTLRKVLLNHAECIEI